MVNSYLHAEGRTLPLPQTRERTRPRCQYADGHHWGPTPEEADVPGRHHPQIDAGNRWEMQDASEDTGTQPAQRKRSTVTHVTKTRPISQKRSRFHTLALQRSQARLTLFSKYFAPFPHGTCSLSVSSQYLASDGMYHQLCAPISGNTTLRTRPVRGSCTNDRRGSHPL